jgi:hypothetical protein
VGVLKESSAGESQRGDIETIERAVHSGKRACAELTARVHENGDLGGATR